MLRAVLAPTLRHARGFILRRLKRFIHFSYVFRWGCRAYIFRLLNIIITYIDIVNIQFLLWHSWQSPYRWSANVLPCVLWEERHGSVLCHTWRLGSRTALTVTPLALALSLIWSRAADSNKGRWKVFLNSYWELILFGFRNFINFIFLNIEGLNLKNWLIILCIILKMVNNVLTHLCG